MIIYENTGFKRARALNIITYKDGVQSVSYALNLMNEFIQDGIPYPELIDITSLSQADYLLRVEAFVKHSKEIYPFVEIDSSLACIQDQTACPLP